jgi:hypothetical protein
MVAKKNAVLKDAVGELYRIAELERQLAGQR